MTPRIATACCLVFSLSLGALAQEAAAPAPPPGISEDDLKKLAADLEKSAVKWDNVTKPNGRFMPLNEIDPAMDKRLAAVIYGEACVPTLTICLTSIKAQKPLNLYITNRLLEPLARATPEVNKAMLSTIDDLYNKTYKYERFAQIKDTKPYQIPPNAPMAAPQAVKKRQQAKMDKETEILRYNQQVAILGARYFRTLARSNDPQADKKLIDMIESMERETPQRPSIAPWLDALAALGGATPMTEERANAILKSKLAALEDTLYMQNKRYASRTRAEIKPDANSPFTDEIVDAGITLTNTMNVFRKAAGQPLRIVPGTSEVRNGYMIAQAKLPDLDKRLKEATRARNAEAVMSLKAQITAAEGAMAAFTRCAGANLTNHPNHTPPDQVQAIFKRADEAGRSLAGARDASKAEYEKALANFAQQIHDSILTPEQRDAIKPKPVAPPPAPPQ